MPAGTHKPMKGAVRCALAQGASRALRTVAQYYPSHWQNGLSLLTVWVTIELTVTNSVVEEPVYLKTHACVVA